MEVGAAMRDVGQSAGLVCGVAAASVAAFTLAIACLTPRPATALPSYAKQTGLACGRCHVNPAGGGANTAFGKAFAANGHKVPGKGAPKGKTVAAKTEAAAAPAASSCRGGYYSPSCNPHFGERPEIDYSTGLSFMVFPQSD